MKIDDIILIVIITLALLFTVRRVYLVLFSKKPPKCSGCGCQCNKLPENSGANEHSCKQ